MNRALLGVEGGGAALLVLGMGGVGGVVDILHPSSLLPLLTGIRKDEGVQGRGVVTSGSGSGGASVGSGPQKAAAGDAGAGGVLEGRRGL